CARHSDECGTLEPELPQHREPPLGKSALGGLMPPRNQRQHTAGFHHVSTAGSQSVNADAPPIGLSRSDRAAHTPRRLTALNGLATPVPKKISDILPRNRFQKAFGGNKCPYIPCGGHVKCWVPARNARCHNIAPKPNPHFGFQALFYGNLASLGDRQ